MSQLDYSAPVGLDRVAVSVQLRAHFRLAERSDKLSVSAMTIIHVSFTFTLKKFSFL